MAELDELIKIRDQLIKIRQLLEAIVATNGSVIERLPEEIKQLINAKNNELENKTQ